jgi:hypothetical protein
MTLQTSTGTFGSGAAEANRLGFGERFNSLRFLPSVPQHADGSACEAVQARRVIDKDLFQQSLVVVDVPIEQFNRLGVIHHPFFTPVHMWPIGG